MKITYCQAKEAAIELADALGVATDTAGHISGEDWTMDDYMFTITAGSKFTFTVPGDMIGRVGSGFPE